MARVALEIGDAAMRLTLEMLLRTQGHDIVRQSPDVRIVDKPEARPAGAVQTLILTPISGVPDAINAMNHGAFGYILMPLQPGEAEIMVAKAVAMQNRGEDNNIAPPSKDWSLAAAEEQHILRVLKQCRGNQAQAAKILGIGRNTLWRKMKNIKRDSPKSD